MDLLDDPVQAKQAFVMFQRILAGSFREEERRHGKEFRKRIQTQDEMNRRADIIAKWFREMRCSLGYSMQKCMAEIPNALRAELDGARYTPPPKDKMYRAAESTIMTAEAVPGGEYNAN